MSDQAEVNRKTAQSNREESAKIQHMINLGWGAALVSTGIKLTMLLFAGTTSLSVIPSLVIWGYFYLQGVRGTFAYHRRVKQSGFVWIQPAGRNGSKTEHFLSRTLAEALQPKEGKKNGRTDRQEGANRRE
jgi:hypothetical protein